MIHWYALSEFAKKLCHQTNRNEIWKNLDELLQKIKIAHSWGIFESEQYQAIHIIQDDNSTWHEIGTKMGELYQLNNGGWKISLAISPDLILHIENPKEITRNFQDFLVILSCLLQLWLGQEKNKTPIAKRLKIPLDISLNTGKEIDEAPTEIIIAKPLSHFSLRSQLTFDYKKIIGESIALIDVLRTIDKIAPSDKIPVLIQGESGTGKELIAQAIHENSPRKDKPFLSENCAAIPETLLESELFGYTKGSFTGAYQDKKGLFEIAHTGTLFLDELGDMSQGMQKKLLRALQEGEIRPVGGKQVKKVDVRLIAATNKNLVEEMKQGRFREDLFYRLNVVNIVLPPLRQRGKDIMLLFQYFIAEQSKNMNKPIPIIEPEVEDFLLHYSWPGNIRQMQNEAKRIMALLDGNSITKKELSQEIIKNTRKEP